MAKKVTDTSKMSDEEVRVKLRRVSYEKVLAYLESDGLVTADEGKVAVQALGVLGKEDATSVHRDALSFAMKRATIRPAKQIESQKKD